MAATIGIKIANGEFYSIIDENSNAKKRLVLTTAHDKQRNVQIDLYRSYTKTAADAQYIGSMVVENIGEKSQGEPSIEMIISCDTEGHIRAEVLNADGRRQYLNVSLESPDEDNRDAPGFEPEKPESPPPGVGMHVLAVKDLRKKFGRKEVVRGVNFSMHNGEVAGLLGPNGAGKTTIFYMIVGFYRPTAGLVYLDQVDITSKPMFRRARQGIAYLPQEASIFRKLTVEQNIWAILESRRDINKAEKKRRQEALLEEFGITKLRRQYGFTLSGGERRRTEIARALATEPKFLHLDEPFAGIDPIAVYEIKQIIRGLAEKGIGVLITDHNVRDTLEITTEAFIIADGSIAARGGREEILNNEMVREVYLGSDFKM
jgi:lipopolysaccharide export system ATP-binding protein